jgi:DNA-binding MarR family transcriptional regulator
MPTASPLQREIRQRKPFRSRGQEGVVGLLRTADLLRRGLSGVIEPHGVTLQQYNVLRILRGAGREGLPTLEIAERMIEHAPGITRLLDRLEKKRLVRRERCASDRRQVLCWITREGRALVSRLDTPVDRADRAALKALGPSELRRLIALLDRVRAAGPPVKQARRS